jgi:hypothetical protein
MKMKNTIIIIAFMFSTTLFAQNNWDTLYQIIDEYSFKSIKDIKIKENFIFTVGNSGLFTISTDLGKSWKDIYVGTDANLNSINYLNQKNIILCGTYGTLTRYDLTLNKSFDLSINSYINLNDIFIIDEQNWLITTCMGYMSSHDGYILKTKNAGINWDTVLSIINFEPKENNSPNGNYIYTNFQFKDIIMKNKLQGFVLGVSYSSEKSFIYETQDGGLNWKLIVSMPDEMVYQMIILDNEIWLVGKNGLMCKSSDDCKTWQWFNKHFNEDIHRIIKYNNTLYVSSFIDKEYKLLSSNNFAKTWTLETSCLKNYNTFNPIINDNYIYISTEKAILRKRYK